MKRLFSTKKRPFVMCKGFLKKERQFLQKTNIFIQNFFFSLFFHFCLSTSSKQMPSSHCIPLGPGNHHDLEQLDDFSLLNVFDELDLPSLLNMASLNSRFYYLISMHNIPKWLDQKTICLVNDYSQCAGPQYVSVKEMDAILKLFQFYGHLIQSLKYVRHKSRSHEQRTIVDHIERYCSNTLTKISFSDMAAMSRPFKNVKTVEIQQYDYSAELLIRRTFPKMETFHFASVIVKRFPTIEQFFPNLRHLRIDSGDSADINAGLEKLLQLNPQIRSLELNRFPNFRLLNVISEKLRGLESLALAYPRAYKPIISYGLGESVHFPSVRSFRIVGEYNSLQLQLPFARFPITFERLERLDIDTPTTDAMSAQLIRQNRQLKALSVPLISDHDYHEVLFNVRQLKELEETTLRWPKRFNANDVEELLHDIGRLKKLSFVVTDGDDSQALEAVCSDEWQCSGRTGFDDKEIITLVNKSVRLSL